MMPPISIDGTDITGATIDGQDVQEITVDGQTVFSAEPGLQDIVESANLIAWYPFENSTDDETRSGGILDNAGITVGDSTDYSGNNQGATFVSSGGVTDLDTGPNSGAFDFDGSNDKIDIDVNGLVAKIDGLASISMMAWAETDSSSSDQFVINYAGARFNIGYEVIGGSGWSARVNSPNISGESISSNDNTTNSYVHLCLTWDGTNAEFYFNGTSQGTAGLDDVVEFGGFNIGNQGDNNHFDGRIDDVRFYDTDLSTSQIETIVENTQDPNNPVFP